MGIHAIGARDGVAKALEAKYPSIFSIHLFSAEYVHRGDSLRRENHWLENAACLKTQYQRLVETWVYTREMQAPFLPVVLLSRRYEKKSSGVEKVQIRAISILWGRRPQLSSWWRLIAQKSK